MLNHQKSVEKLKLLKAGTYILRNQIYENLSRNDLLDLRQQAWGHTTMTLLGLLEDFQNIILNDCLEYEESKDIKITVRCKQSDFFDIREKLDEKGCSWEIENL